MYEKFVGCTRRAYASTRKSVYTISGKRMLIQFVGRSTEETVVKVA